MSKAIASRFAAPMLTISIMASLIPPASAVNPDEVLRDPALEQRARVISQDLRCLVCQNQSIDDSNAPLAKDLRIIVRERLEAGDSDEQVVKYIVARYGNYVLLKPPLQLDTALLWLSPYLIFAMAIAVSATVFLRRGNGVEPDPYSSDDDPVAPDAKTIHEDT